MATLFNFVTVRNPRTPTQGELATGFIRYDDAIKAQWVEGTAKVRANDPDAARDLLEKAKGSDPRIVEDTEALATAAPDLTRLAQWLAHHADSLTWKTWEEALHDPALIPSRSERSETDAAKPRTGKTSASRKENQAIWALLWDNLTVLTYAGGRPELRELVVWSLRAANLLSWTGPREDDEAARRLATATPLFPTRVHGLTSMERRVSESGSAPAPEQEVLDLRSARATAEAAHRELSEQLASARTAQRSAPVPPLFVPSRSNSGCFDTDPGGESGAEPVAPARYVIDTTVWQGLSAASRKVLSRLDIATGDALDEALTRVAESAHQLGTQVATSSPGGRRISALGGALWVEGTPRRGASDEPVMFPRDLSGVNSYAHFWGTHDTGPDDLEKGGRCRVRPLGIGDFRRVEQELRCNRPAEVAHIENVMAGETKERTTSHRTTVETFASVTSDEERSSERDSQTTDRFEMEKEVNKTIESDLSFEIGVNIAAQYGPVKLTADTKFATSQSSKESDKQAVKYAKEVTDKTLEKVVTKVREERSTRTIEEFTETNRHRLTADEQHVVGLYRWVEKVYRARVVNYGKRLMFEFLVPEPAAFHLHAMADGTTEVGAGLVKPVDPRSDETHAALGAGPIMQHLDITEANYAFWTAAYGATVDPAPARRVTTSKAYARADMDQNVQFADAKSDLALPTGTEADWFTAVYGLHAENHDGGPNWLTVAVGRNSKFTTAGGTFSAFLNGEDDVVPVTVMGRTRMYGVNVQVECTRTSQAYEAWQQKTYRAILAGYAAQLAAYETALAEAKAAAGVVIRGTNPALNRQTESIELQKGCLRLLTAGAGLSSEAMKDGGEYGYPEFSPCTAIRDGSIVQFFEQLFEWRLMTYVFYPYFWGRKSKWTEFYRLDDVDPLFLSFLKAGYARVVVPVRPGYEAAAMRFLADGALWDGGSAPGVDDPMYVSMVNEMKEPVGVVDPSIEPWDVVVPTTLTVLQCTSGCVPGTGLPCSCDEDDKTGDPDVHGESGDG